MADIGEHAMDTLAKLIILSALADDDEPTQRDASKPVSTIGLGTFIDALKARADDKGKKPCSACAAASTVASAADAASCSKAVEKESIVIPITHSAVKPTVHPAQYIYCRHNSWHLPNIFEIGMFISDCSRDDLKTKIAELPCKCPGDIQVVLIKRVPIATIAMSMLKSVLTETGKGLNNTGYYSIPIEELNKLFSTISGEMVR